MIRAMSVHTEWCIVLYARSDRVYFSRNRNAKDKRARACVVRRPK